MRNAGHAQLTKLEHLIKAARNGIGAADRGLLFSSRAGLMLIRAAFDLFECDGLYDLGCDVAHEIAAFPDETC